MGDVTTEPLTDNPLPKIIAFWMHQTLVIWGMIVEKGRNTLEQIGVHYQKVMSTF